MSVIIPVYNGELFLAQAVASALRQDPPVAEIIVVDDGSTDGTAKIAQGLDGVSYVFQSNQGPAAARNHGVCVARGHLLCFLDADDRMTGDKTRVQMPMFADDPSLDIAVGCLQRVVITGWNGDEPLYREMGDAMFSLHLGSAMIRRSVIDRIGMFEERLAMGEDVDWYLRAKEMGIRMKFHSEIVQYRLLHDRNMTLQRDTMNRHLVRVFKRSLDRRRQSSGGIAKNSWDWSQETRTLRDAGEHRPDGPNEPE